MTIQDYSGLFRTVQNYKGLYRTMLTIQDYTGQQDYTGLYKTILDSDYT